MPQHVKTPDKAFILGRIAGGATVTRMAKEYHVSRPTIYSWMDKWKSGNLHRKKTEQPNRATTSEEDAAVVAEKMKYPCKTARQIRADLYLKQKVSVRTVRRRLQLHSVSAKQQSHSPPAKEENLNTAQEAVKLEMAQPEKIDDK